MGTLSERGEAPCLPRSLTDDAYAAGLFDGEGYIGVVQSAGTYRLQMTITQKDPEMLYWVQARWGGRIFQDRHCWKLFLSGYRVGIPFIEAILPYSIYKHPQLLLGLEFFGQHNAAGKTAKQKREEIMQGLFACKR